MEEKERKIERKEKREKRAVSSERRSELQDL